MLSLSIFTTHHVDWCILESPPHITPSPKPLDSQDTYTEKGFDNGTHSREDNNILIKIICRSNNDWHSLIVYFIVDIIFFKASSPSFLT
jgi:hypothetical protein